MSRYRTRYFLLAGAVIALPLLLLGVAPALQDLINRMTALEGNSTQITSRVQALEADSQVVQELVTRVETLEADPVLSDLITRVELIEEALFSDPIETVLFNDDFEDGIDPAWVQVVGLAQTIAPTGTCVDYAWDYHNCGSLGLHIAESVEYHLDLPQAEGPSIDSFSLYFHDNPTDTAAAFYVGMGAGLEWMGVVTEVCPNHYFVGMVGSVGKVCTKIKRKLGWHKLEFVRDGRTSKGYIDRVLVFEANSPNSLRATQARLVHAPSPANVLDGFVIDDVRFIATGGN